MSGIAGIAAPGKRVLVESMSSRMAHRGPAGIDVLELDQATLGAAWSVSPHDAPSGGMSSGVVFDGPGVGHTAGAQVVSDTLELKRDPLGVVPLYYGYDAQGHLCFASEVKALLEATRDVHELLPGCRLNDQGLQAYFELEQKPPYEASPEEMVDELRRRLQSSVEQRIEGDQAGAWLSGGLDSSTMAALARQYVSHLYTFAAGLEGAPDLDYARMVAEHIGSEHHDVVVDLHTMLDVLPDVIYHLESFDALLVRSSITNYLVARRAADYVSTVFSGEGGDELFAGYSYLKSLDLAELPGELIDITARLHNTALQRVDRCASAHGTTAMVGFLDAGVVDYALGIPAEYKLHDGVEKWVLRQAVKDLLPPAVVDRPKAKFWEGAGVSEWLSQYADEKISDQEFSQERSLPNGWQLNSKEELLYYRIFRQHFGEFEDLSWMGRTKGAPVE